MNSINQYSRILLLFMSLLAVGYACKPKPQDTPQPQAGPTITSIDPATAPVGSTIAINGTNFDANSTGNTVTIGGVQATIVSVTPTRIIVTVPAGAVAGPISVTAGGQSAQSTVSFTPGSTTPVPAGAKPIAEKQGTYFRNQTWSSDSIYVLRGMVYIPENYTLTIAPGTIIRGAGPERDPSGTNHPGTLVIERRGQLIAKGTATQPIVFTSAKAVGQRSYGDWGGLVLVGKSPINRPGATALPNGVRNTVQTYGEPADNSGVLQYVRIEYAGAVQPTTPTSRLAGLTLIGVGANTVIDHVQVSYSGGDAYSWFGGTVNLKNLFAFSNFDDDWSSAWGYAGNVQFGAALRDPNVADLSGSNGFEVENYETTETADVSAVVPINGQTQAAPVFANFSSFAFSGTPVATNAANGTGAYQSAINLRRNSAISIYNSLFYGYPQGVRLESAGTASALTSGAIDLKGIVLANVTTPIVGAGVITTDQATTYFTTGRNNQIIASTDVASLLLNTETFSLSAPGLLPQTGSPLLTGAVTGGKVGGAFFTAVTYRGAFGTTNWLTGWTNLNPQTTDYDR